MADWKPARYLINQGDDPKVEVEGYTCLGLGVKKHDCISDKWPITHLNSGLHVMDVYGESFEDVLIYLNEIASSADLVSLINVDPRNPNHQALFLRCSQIQNINAKDYDARVRAREAGALTGGQLQ